MSGYALLDRPNAHGRHYYPTRRTCQHGIDGPHLIVAHTSEQLPDYRPPDDGAEALTGYAQTTERLVSWHDSVDADSWVPLLPSSHTAWHVRGFNRCGHGIEMATKAHLWGAAPGVWVGGTIGNFARAAAAVIVASADPQRWILDRELTRAEVDRGAWGFVSHARLDPGRRTDPGRAYPWAVALARTRDLVDQEEEGVKRKFIRVAGRPTVYEVTGNVRFPFVSRAVAEAQGIDLEHDVEDVPANHVLAQLPVHLAEENAGADVPPHDHPHNHSITGVTTDLVYVDG